MYKLSTGDMENSKYMRVSESEIPKFLELYSHVTINEIKAMLFNNPIDDDIYDNISFLLTISDMLPTPILYSMAKDLYYILQVNYAYYHKKSDIKLTTYPQAALLIDETNGNYVELTQKIDERKKVRFSKFLARHKCLFPECTLFWQIPISFYKQDKTGKSMCTLAAVMTNPYAIVSIPALDIHDIRVPKSIYMKFFEDSMTNGKLAVEADSSSIGIKECFDETLVEPVLTVLGLAGLQKFHNIVKNDNTEYYYSEDHKALVAHLHSKDSDVEAGLPEEERVYWSKLGFKEYRFLNPGAEYVPVKVSSDIISIYKV